MQAGADVVITAVVTVVAVVVAVVVVVIGVAVFVIGVSIDERIRQFARLRDTKDVENGR
jgi:hypothetical protein